MTIRLQTVLFHNGEEEFALLLQGLVQMRRPGGVSVILATGDCSEEPCLNDSFITEWARRLREAGCEWTHQFFDANLGFGASHNRLAAGDPTCDALLLLNPDATIPPSLLERLWSMASEKPDWGMVEARQIPLEHPKEFDPVSRVTSWSSGACVLIRGKAFREVSGFDEQFFMYAEDVDLSWRLRSKGYNCYYCLKAYIYHAKRLDFNGIVPSSHELLHGSLSSLILLEKYGRTAQAARLLSRLKASPVREHQQGARLFEERRASIRLPERSTSTVADIGREGEFGKVRWQYMPPDEFLREL